MRGNPKSLSPYASTAVSVAEGMGRSFASNHLGIAG